METIAGMIIYLGQIITLPAGLARMALGRFGIVVFWGALTWCTYLRGIGIFFAERIRAVENNLHLIGMTLGILLFLAIFSFFILRRTIFKYYRTIRWRDANSAPKTA